jgi:hypothetical protein
MEDQKINITVENGVKELIIREGSAIELPKIEAINISGNIDSPLRFLEKRINTDLRTSMITVNREGLIIVLYTDEHNQTGLGEEIIGKLIKTEAFEAFKINSGKTWLSRELGQFIKMNRTCFESKEIANDLAAKLNDFKAKLDKELEHNDNNRGNVRILKDQKIKECNIPEKFSLQIPIFKGAPKVLFEVEVYINADDLSITLVSPDANDIIAQVRDESIDNVLNQIKNICPSLVIIEQ